MVLQRWCQSVRQAAPLAAGWASTQHGMRPAPHACCCRKWRAFFGPFEFSNEANVYIAHFTVQWSGRWRGRRPNVQDRREDCSSQKSVGIASVLRATEGTMAISNGQSQDVLALQAEGTYTQYQTPRCFDRPHCACSHNNQLHSHGPRRIGALQVCSEPTGLGDRSVLCWHSCKLPVFQVSFR